MDARTISSLTACFAASVFAVGPIASARAHVGAIAPRAEPVEPQVGAFNRARDEATAAAEADDWDVALRRADEGLRALPESEATHPQRAFLIDLVGKFHVEQRNRAQLDTSASILRAYIDELERVHGRAVDRLQAWNDANHYLDEIEGRLEENTPPPPPSAVAAEPQDETDHGGERPRSSRALQAAGGSAIAVGGVLTIVGIVFAARWSREARAYNELEMRDDENPGSVLPDDEQEQFFAWRRARARALGIGIPGLALVGVGIALVVLGTRRTNANKRVALSGTSVQVRF